MKLSKTNNNISFEPSDSQDVSKEIKLSQAKRLFFFLFYTIYLFRRDHYYGPQFSLDINTSESEMGDVTNW